MYTGLCASLISNVIPSCNKETIDMKPTNYPWYLLALSLFHTDLASKIFIDLSLSMVTTISVSKYLPYHKATL